MLGESQLKEKLDSVIALAEEAAAENDQAKLKESDENFGKIKQDIENLIEKSSNEAT